MRKTPEGRFKESLVEELEAMFTGCIILWQDARQQGGIPDMLVLFRDRWAMLEAKESEDAVRQPNQPYWVDKLNRMSFSAFVYPENREDVIHELAQFFL